jgi:hypothetical protein
MTDDFTRPDNTMPFDDSKPTAASQAVNGVKAASQQFSDAIQAWEPAGHAAVYSSATRPRSAASSACVSVHIWRSSRLPPVDSQHSPRRCNE